MHKHRLSAHTPTHTLTILPDVEDLVEASVLHAPIAHELRVCRAQVDLLVGEAQERRILVWLDAICAELIECPVLLLVCGDAGL